MCYLTDARVFANLKNLKNFAKKKLIQKELQMNIIKKYLKKDIYLQKKDRTLLMIWDIYNNAIMEYQKMINF